MQILTLRGGQQSEDLAFSALNTRDQQQQQGLETHESEAGREESAAVGAGERV